MRASSEGGVRGDPNHTAVVHVPSKAWLPKALAAEIRQLRDLSPAFGIRGIRRSLIEAAEQALEVGDPECREIAEQLLREVRKIPN
jgi:hypothetical protein